MTQTVQLQTCKILDTNVILHDPQVLRTLDAHEIVVPIYVIQEIDKFKKEMSERGRNAREASRILDEYRSKGGLLDGVHIGGGRKLWVHPALDIKTEDMDSAILKTAENVTNYRYDEQLPPPILLTKDTNMRIRADLMRVLAEDYDSSPVKFDEMYTGVTERSGPLSESLTKGLYENQFVSWTNGDESASTQVWTRFSEGDLRFLERRSVPVWGVLPRSDEQRLAFDLLMDDKIKLVTLVGKAGTGKTLLALAAGLQKSIEDGIYEKLIVARPVHPLGKDIGYLPGTVEEKMDPWMKPIYDNIEFLLNLSNKSKDKRRAALKYEELFELGYIEIEPLTFIRGRSIPNQFIIIDEAQNLSPHEVKTIITRVGEGTKIVLTGDPYQIDNPYVDATNNGLTTVVERFKGQRLAGHVTLTKGERSPLAELAANLL